MRMRLVVSVLVVMGLVYGALAGWRYLLRRANEELRTAVPGMVEEARRSSGSAFEVGRRSSTYRLGTNHHVTIDNPSGDIDVTAGGPQVSVESVIYATGTSHDAAAAKASAIRLEESRAPDGGLTLSVVRDREVRNVWMQLRVQVPPDVGLRVTGGSGNVQVADLQGPVTAEVGSGNVTARNLAGGADLRTGSGNVTADGVRGGVSADSGSGDLRLTAVSGEIAAHADSGNVTASVSTSTRVIAESGSGNVAVTLGQPFDGMLEAHAGSGNVTISLPAGSDCRVRAATGSGNVRSTLPLTEVSRTQSELGGRLGAGRGNVTAESGSGDVEVRGLEN
jgi:DUF4097 and DUF4098 domain-containing protein YvlB